jgi:hypothetical protein
MKYQIIPILLIAGLSTPLFAQKNWQVIPKVGVTVPFHVFETKEAYPGAVLFSGAVNNSYFFQKGALLGLGVERKLGRYSAIKAEANAILKENVWLFPWDSTGTYADYSRTFTLQIPFLYSFQLTKMIQLEAGSQFTQVLYSAPYTFANSFEVNKGAKNNLVRASNIALCAGMTYRLGRFDLSVRWTRDLLVFARHHDTVASITDEYRQDVQFTVGYRLFRSR